MKYRGKTYNDKFGLYVRNFVIESLSLQGYNSINGKELSKNKSKALFDLYSHEFITDPFKAASKQYKADHPPVSKAKRKGYVYFIVNEEFTFCKIGFSEKPNSRLSEIQTGCPYRLKIHHSLTGTQADEYNLHKRYSHLNSQGEWFRIEDDLKEYLLSIKNKTTGSPSILRFIDGINENDIYFNKGAYVESKMGHKGKVFFNRTFEKGKCYVQLDNNETFLVYPHNLKFIGFF